MPRVLILTGNTGGGHVSLAEALRDALDAQARIALADPLPEFVGSHYRVVSRYARWVWAAEYALLDSPRRALVLQRIAARVLARKLGTLLRGGYDVVVTTFPFLSYAVMRAIRLLPRSLPFVLLLTDPDRLHAAALTERGAVATFAPTRETHAQALAAGFAPDRLHLSGWPVRRQFYEVDHAARAVTLARLQLDPQRLTLFIQGGGEGSAGVARTVETAIAVARHDAPDALQIIVAAGTNQRLIERFSGVEHVRTIPFTRAIAPFMAAADVVMGKAGPNALFEAITLGKPFIATTYLPGQELANLAFIRTYHLGWVALDERVQRTLITALIADAGRLRAMEETVLRYRSWNTAATAIIAPQIATIAREARDA